MSEIILQGLSVEDLLKQIGEMFDDKIKNYGTNKSQEQDENIMRKEAASILRISLPTLHEWTKSGNLQYHKIKGRVLYKRSEIEKLLTTNAIRKHKRI